MSHGDEPVACLNCQMPDFPRQLAHARLDLELDRHEAQEQAINRRADIHIVKETTNDPHFPGRAHHHGS